MSYTNQTQHYGLPQYVGTDVPAYLTDYNGAMATIDQGMNAAKTQADAAATAAGQATNDIAALNSTVNTQATQISAAAQAASNAQSTANTADGKVDALDTRVTALERDSGIKYVDITGIPANAEVTTLLPQNAKPINAVILSWGSASVSSGLGYYPCIASLGGEVGRYFIVFKSIGATSTEVIPATDTVIRVFYAV